MNRYQADLLAVRDQNEIRSMTLVIQAEDQDQAEGIAEDVAEQLRMSWGTLDLDSCWELA
jgi:hypothetical protein